MHVNIIVIIIFIIVMKSVCAARSPAVTSWSALQVQEWKGSADELHPTDWGWQELVSCPASDLKTQKSVRESLVNNDNFLVAGVWLTPARI